jgi:hypothetical protein
MDCMYDQRFETRRCVCVVDAASAKRVKEEVSFTLLICGESKKMNRYKSLEPYIGITK